MAKLGFVYFYDKEDNDGYIGFSFCDDRKYKKIKTVDNLSKEKIWVSNRVDNLLDNIKPSNFLSISVDEIMYFLNIGKDNIDSNCHYIFEVINNAYLKLSENYKIDITENNLSKGIFKNFKVNKYRFNEALIRDFINKRKDIIFMSNNLKKDPSKKRIILSYIDYFYIREICKQELPLGGWKKSSIKELNNYSDRKFILKVKVLSTKEWVSKVIHKSYMDSAWIIDTEYKFLIDAGCEIKIMEIYSSNKTFFLKNIEPNKLFRIKEEENNISNYIAAKNYLSSFKNKNSIINAWLSQYEKINSMKISFILASMGVDILAYGNNIIVVNINRSEENKIIKLAEKIGINFPTLMFDRFDKIK